MWTTTKRARTLGARLPTLQPASQPASPPGSFFSPPPARRSLQRSGPGGTRGERRGASATREGNARRRATPRRPAGRRRGTHPRGAAAREPSPTARAPPRRGGRGRGRRPDVRAGPGRAAPRRGKPPGRGACGGTVEGARDRPQRLGRDANPGGGADGDPRTPQTGNALLSPGHARNAPTSPREAPTGARRRPGEARPEAPSRPRTTRPVAGGRAGNDPQDRVRREAAHREARQRGTGGRGQRRRRGPSSLPRQAHTTTARHLDGSAPSPLFSFPWPPTRWWRRAGGRAGGGHGGHRQGLHLGGRRARGGPCEPDPQPRDTRGVGKGLRKGRRTPRGAIDRQATLRQA